jgi:hypothetical protein
MSCGPIIDIVALDNPSVIPGMRIRNIRPMSCWVSPDGAAYYVPECGHSRTAPIIMRDVLNIDDNSIDGETFLSGRGWLHLSIFYRDASMVLQCRNDRMTRAQAETVAEMCDNATEHDAYAFHRYSWDEARGLLFDMMMLAADMAER